MVSDRLKKVIFKKLYKDLSHVEIIPYENSIYFIDSNEKYWYFEFEKSGKLWWRHDFFSDFFVLFSLEREQYEKIMSDWVEEVLNHKVSITKNHISIRLNKVEEVLNHKISTSYRNGVVYDAMVEEVLNHKVTKRRSLVYEQTGLMEEVLNHKVSTTNVCNVVRRKKMEEVLNHKVSTTIESLCGDAAQVEEILNCNKWIND